MHNHPHHHDDEGTSPAVIVLWLAAALVIAFVIWHEVSHKQVPAQHSAQKV